MTPDGATFGGSPAPVGRWRVLRVAETGSTNTDLLTLAATGEVPGLVLVADHQTAGKGRLGRTWSAPPGASLLVSVLLLTSTPSAAEVASGFTVTVPDLSGSFKHVLLDSGSRLTALADVIPLRIGGLGQVISLGDVFLAVGLGRFLEHELRRPRRYFKRGAHAQPGSASKP